MNGKTCKALRRGYKKNNGGEPAKQAYFETVDSLSIPVYDTRKEKKLLRTRHNRMLVPAIMSEWRPFKSAYMAMKRQGAPLQNFRALADPHIEFKQSAAVQ
jgi:hypothetical protein